MQVLNHRTERLVHHVELSGALSGGADLPDPDLEFLPLPGWKAGLSDRKYKVLNRHK